MPRANGLREQGKSLFGAGQHGHLVDSVDFVTSRATVSVDGKSWGKWIMLL